MLEVILEGASFEDSIEPSFKEYVPMLCGFILDSSIDRFANFSPVTAPSTISSV